MASYLYGINMGSFQTLDVRVRNSSRTMNAQIDTQSLDAWKSYLRWRALHDAAPWLSDPFVQENFKFYGAVAGAAGDHAQVETLHAGHRQCSRRSCGAGLG